MDYVLWVTGNRVIVPSVVQARNLGVILDFFLPSHGNNRQECQFYLFNISLIHAFLSNHLIPPLDQIAMISSMDSFLIAFQMAFLLPVLFPPIHSPKCGQQSLHKASLTETPPCLKVFKTIPKYSAWEAGPSQPHPNWPAGLLAPLTPRSCLVLFELPPNGQACFHFWVFVPTAPSAFSMLYTVPHTTAPLPVPGLIKIAAHPYCERPCSKHFYALGHLILISTLWGRYYHGPLLQMSLRDFSKLSHVPLLSAPRAAFIIAPTMVYFPVGLEGNRTSDFWWSLRWRPQDVCWIHKGWRSSEIWFTV